MGKEKQTIETPEKQKQTMETPGKEKRQNKYFWPKIADRNKKTPKPNTPRLKTPKQKRGKYVKVDQPIESQTEEVGSSFQQVNFDHADPIIETPAPKTTVKLMSVEETKDHLMCARKLDFGGEKPVVRLVYHRKGIVNNPCLGSCRAMGSSVKRVTRRMRSLRRWDRIVREYETFDQFGIDNKVLRQLTMFRRILRLRPLTQFKKRRTVLIRFRSTGGTSGNAETSNDMHKSPAANDLPSQDNLPSQGNVSSQANLPSDKREPKPKKKRGPYKKRTKKPVDYLNGINESKDLEGFVDSLVNQFKAMTLYDNPKALGRWFVRFGTEETFEEDRDTLVKNMTRCVQTMTDIQGSREFVEWHGSVLNSMVGVFLTQNVSDVLSSNAYMALGSHFPIKSSHQLSIDTPSCSATPTIVFPDEDDEDETTTQDEQERLRTKHFNDSMKEMLKDASVKEMFKDFADGKKKKSATETAKEFNWDKLRVKFAGEEHQERSHKAQDSVDWEAVRKAPVEVVSDVIRGRGQQTILAGKILAALNRIVKDHGSLDLEWVRKLPDAAAKAYLLSFHGLGLKSTECIRLLTLHHHAFPVDVNIARIVVRLGWVPLEELPMGTAFHKLPKYPLESDIQRYMWPKLKHLSQRTLYNMHCQLITFGKIFCTKANPNCSACPFQRECKYYQSVVASSPLRLPGGQQKTSKSKGKTNKLIGNPFNELKTRPRHNYPHLGQSSNSCLEIVPGLSSQSWSENYEPASNIEPTTVEMPPTPVRIPRPPVRLGTDMEDTFNDENDTIEINFSTEKRLELSLTLRSCLEQTPNPSEGNDFLANALVKLNPAFAPPRQNNAVVNYNGSTPRRHAVSARLSTKHLVFELPDEHPLLSDFRMRGYIRDRDEPLPYLLKMWLPDKHENGKDGEGNIEEALALALYSSQHETVPATILIPSRTAMGGNFPLNGTYFQFNEVFADYETSECPVNVSTGLLSILTPRVLYCGWSTPAIFKDMTWEDVKNCCVYGFVCLRGFNRSTRAPKQLSRRFHGQRGTKGKPLGSDAEV